MRATYLFTLSDRPYAVWKDEVESVRKVETIHRLPFSPDCIVGLAIIDKHSTALADLAALIGLPPLDRDAQAQLLFITGQKKDAGFVVTGEITEISIHEESARPMPTYVATPEISTCIIDQEKLVPLIDLKALYQHIHAQNLNPSVPTLPIPDKPPSPAEINGIKLFTAGGEVFALPIDMVGNTFDKPLDLTTIPLTPSFLKGIIVEENTITPVIDLAEKMNLPNPGNSAKVLMVETGGDNFGFLIDNDSGTLSTSDFSLHPLPPLAKSSLINTVAIHNREIIPLVDPRAIIDPEPTKTDDIALAEQYPPEPGFGERFHREQVEIVEFTLLGERHALPKTEVGDILPITTFRRIPALQSLVTGITEYQGEILPVLDLALVFGRRSQISGDGQMILVNNGNFRAFIITETVQPERILPLNIQKTVPLSLPHKLVYGCYPDGNIVRLILNVKVLALHFDKTVVKNFLSSLTKEMAETAAAVVPALLPAKEILRLAKSAQQKKTKEHHRTDNIPPGKNGADSRETEVLAESNSNAPAQEEPQREKSDVADPQETEQMHPANEFIILEQIQEESPPPASNDELPESIEVPILLSEMELPQEDQDFATLPENKAKLTEDLATKLDQLDVIKLHSNEVAEISLGQNTYPVDKDQIRQFSTEQLPEQEQQTSIKTEEIPQKHPTEAAKERPRTQEIKAQRKRDAQILAQAKEERLKMAAAVKKNRVKKQDILHQQKQTSHALFLAKQEHLKQQKEFDRQKAATEAQEEPEETAPARTDDTNTKIDHQQQTRTSEKERLRVLAEFRDQKKRNKKDHKRLFVLLALLLLLLINIFLFFEIPQKQLKPPRSENNFLKGTATGKDEKTGHPVITPDIKETEGLPTKPTDGPNLLPSLKKEQPPLTIIVPDTIPLTTHIYKVKRGDTLWNISMRFTGTPYNYPLVARENDINNPDLIYPGQHILLKRAGKQ